MSSDVERRLDALEAWQNAAKTQLKRLREENEELKERVAELEALVDPDPGSVEYEQLTKPQRVHKVRVHLATMAENAGEFVMKYRDVKTLFDGHPSDGYCYELMEQAAQIDGFAYETGGHGKGEKRLRVDPDDVNDERVVHAVNNADQATPA